MLEVYNHFIHTYYPKYKASKPAKQKEAADMYKKIAAMNKKQPLYKLNMNENKQQFALHVKDYALSLKNQLDVSADPDAGLFSAYKVVSDNTETASVEMLAQDPAALPEQITLKVSQLAKPQVNESHEVPSGEVSRLAGSYSFTMDIEDRLYEFQFHITPGSTNEAIFTKLTDFIHKTNVGVHIETVSEPPNTKLRMISDSTGDIKMPLFTLKDTDKSGQGGIGIVEYYGLDTITEHSKSSLIEINGEKRETLKNKFTFNRALSVTLHKENEEPVRIQAAPDIESIRKNTKPLLDTFNSLMDLAADHKDNLRSAKLRYDLNHVVRNHYEALTGAGIISNDEDHLEFSGEESAPFDTEHLKSLLSSESGFYQDLRKTAFQISVNPMDYLDKLVVAYPDSSIQHYPNPYAVSAYSGMMFNWYC